MGNLESIRNSKKKSFVSKLLVVGLAANLVSSMAFAMQEAPFFEAQRAAELAQVSYVRMQEHAQPQGQESGDFAGAEQEQQVAPEQQAIHLLNALSAEHSALLAGHSRDDLEKVAELMRLAQWPKHTAFLRALEQQVSAEQAAQAELQSDAAHERELAEQEYVMELLYAVGAKHRSNGAWYDTQKQKSIRTTKLTRCMFIITVIVSAGLVSFGYNVPCSPYRAQ